MQRVRFNFNLCIVYLGQLYSCHLIQGNHKNAIGQHKNFKLLPIQL